MKITRRRRHIRPRPARAQVLQQIRHLSRRLQLSARVAAGGRAPRP